MKLNKTEINILAGKIYKQLEKENLKLEDAFVEEAKEDVKKYMEEIKKILPDYIFKGINDEYFENQIQAAIEEKSYKRKYNFYQSDVSDDIILKLANNAYNGDVETLENDLLTKYKNDAE